MVERIRQFKSHEGEGGLLAMTLLREEIGKKAEERRVKANGKKKF